jgi:hypothetical protein
MPPQTNGWRSSHSQNAVIRDTFDPLLRAAVDERQTGARRQRKVSLSHRIGPTVKLDVVESHKSRCWRLLLRFTIQNELWVPLAFCQ